MTGIREGEGEWDANIECMSYRQQLSIGRASLADAKKFSTIIRSGKLPSPGWRLYACVLLSLLSPLQFGWLTTQLNTPNFHGEQCLKEKSCNMFNDHSEGEWLLIVNAWIVGGALGALCSGVPADTLGRKATLLLNAALMILGAGIQALAPSVPVMIVGRLISGVVSGVGVAVSGVYIGEISPATMRGTLGTGVQLAIITGLVAVTGAIFEFDTKQGWRYLVAFPILLGILQLMLAFVMVESPRWLISKCKQSRALAEIQKLYGCDEEAKLLIYDEMTCGLDIEETTLPSPTNVAAKKNPIARVLNRTYHKQLIIAIGLCIFQQISGINAIFYYSSVIFARANIKDPREGTLIVAVVNAVATVLTVPFMDRVGRRRLLLIGTFGMLVSGIGITIALVKELSVESVVFGCLYAAFFEIGLGPVTWIIAAEIFPEEIRAHAGSIAIFFNWTSNLVVALTFPSIDRAISAYAFVPFIGTLALALLFIYFRVPETKNKTLAEIQRDICADAVGSTEAGMS